MTSIDWMILIIILVGAVIGWSKGFMRQLVSFVGFFAGLLVACSFYSTVGEKLAPHLGTSDTIGHVLAFVLIWVAIPLLLSVVASLLSRLMDAICLGWLNGLAGAVFGGLKYALFVSIFINILQFVDFNQKVISQTKKEESMLYYPTGKLVKFLFPSEGQKAETTQETAEINE